MEKESEYLKDYSVIEYKSFSNSGKTYYGIKRKTYVETILDVGQKDTVIFNKKYTEMSSLEKEKYKDVLGLEYTEYLKNEEFAEKYRTIVAKYIHKFKDKLKFPIFIDQVYDNYSYFFDIPKNTNYLIVLNNISDFEKYDDNIELIYCIINEIGGWNYELDVYSDWFIKEIERCR